MQSEADIPVGQGDSTEDAEMIVHDDGDSTFSVIFNELPSPAAANMVSGLTRAQAYEVQRLAGDMFDAGMRQAQRSVRIALGINIGE